MRRALGILAVSVFLGSVLMHPAVAAPAPTPDGAKKVLLTPKQTAKAAGYSGRITGGKDCTVSPGDFVCYTLLTQSDKSGIFPATTRIIGYNSAEGVAAFFNGGGTPTYPDGVRTPVQQGANAQSWYVVYTDPSYRPTGHAMVLLPRGGVVEAVCGSGTDTPDFGALITCAQKLANAQARKARTSKAFR